MLRILYFVVTAALAAFYYYGVGAGPGPSEIFDDLEWWRPRGWISHWEIFSGLMALTEEEAEYGGLVAALFCVPPVALAVGAFFLFRSAVLRALFFWINANLCVFAYYGLLAERVWRFFEWRFVAVTASFTGVVTVLLFAPSLLRALARIPKLVSGVLLLLIFGAVFVLSTEITGTDSDMRFNLTPWPVITVFGFLLAGYSLAALHVAAGGGLWLWARIGGLRGAASGIVVAAVAGAALSFLVFSDPSARALGFFALVGVLYVALAAWLRSEGSAPLTTSGTSRLAAGVIIAAMIYVSNQAAFSYQVTARNETALKVLLALEEYKKVNNTYPDRLGDLQPEFLEEIPRPQIGLILDEDDEFDYSNFGDSYALEFASVQWVQCAYSPPYEFASYDDEEEEEAGEDAVDGWGEWDSDVAAGSGDQPAEEDDATRQLRKAGLPGSWNCAEEPPKIW